MNKSQTLLDPSSCLNKAGNDEPVFVLRANDFAAAQTIRHWASMSYGMRRDEKIQSALLIADAMEEWLAKQSKVIESATEACKYPR